MIECTGMVSVGTKVHKLALKRHGWHLKSAIGVTSGAMMDSSGNWNKIRFKIGCQLCRKRDLDHWVNNHPAQRFKCQQTL